jgi:hypothetical protein
VSLLPQSGTDHPSLRVPTLFHADYVTGRFQGALKLGHHAHPYTVVRQKHCGRKVLRGSYAGSLVTSTFTDGLEALAEATGFYLTSTLLSAHFPSARAMLMGVPKCVRLGGEHSLSMQACP